MRLTVVLLSVALSYGAFAEASAQLPQGGARPADSATAPGRRVKGARPSPTLVGQPAAAGAQPAATGPAGTADSAGRPGRRVKAARRSPTLAGQPAPAGAAQPAGAPAGAAAGGAQGPRAAVTPQAAAAPATGSAFTAGLAIEPFSGEEAQRNAYLRRYTQLLDSTIASMVGVFRNTSGQPLAGATGPSSLSQRERDRWTTCRNLHWDLQSYVSAMEDLVENVPDNPGVQRAAQGLDSALAAVDATSECDNVASMITAPDRWTPWGQQYTASARHFYADWYGQVREVAERNRAFVIALNVVLPAAQRVPVPPAMPRNPPYAGAAPR